jgi:signal transduction histidine kinase
MLASLVILAAGMFLIGEWVGQQIEEGVVHRTAATTALYVDSFISPDLQELADHDSLSLQHKDHLNQLLKQTEFGRHVAAFKVWTKQGRIVYSLETALIGKQFPVQDGLAMAVGGQVAAEISNLSNAENVLERTTQSRLLEMYTPVRRTGAEDVIAVAEVYYSVDDLESEISAAQQRSWLVFGVCTLAMYLLLAGFVRDASRTISRQRTTLSEQVTQLQTLLAQNATLHERVRRAAARTTALNERFLRRVSAELHDGPAQELGLALLRLDHAIAHAGPNGAGPAPGAPPAVAEELEIVQGSLDRAMQEVRAISSGLGLPQMEHWTLAETLSRVVSTHERRTGTKAVVRLDCPTVPVSLPVKITLYRLVQEGLTNAYRHAGGVGQQVTVQCVGDNLAVEISDQGPGFDGSVETGPQQHLGLVGMRERVESLGGVFHVESAPGRGTRITAQFALGAQDER